MAPPPSTPRNRDPEDAADFRFKTNGTPCEWGESYHPGGYHPVILGDVLQDRYRIIRKLGYGAFSTAWLAVDLRLNCFVALKVAVASSDREALDKSVAVYNSLPQTENGHVVGLRDSFEVLGPNGRHACLAMEPMGPHISALMKGRPEFQERNVEPWERRPRFPKQLARRVLRDALLGLCVLHRHGIVHADLHPGNILATISPLGEPLSDASLEPKLQQLPSEGTPLVRRDGKADLWAPSYLLAPAPLQDHVSFELEPVVKLADLGAAFFEDHPPPTVVTPVALRAPETILRGTLPWGRGIDLWAFGCLMFELLTGRTLFVRLEALDGYEESDEDTNDDHLVQLSEVLGPLPAELALRWRHRDQYYDLDGKRLATAGRDVSGDGVSDTDGDDSDDKDEAMPPDSPTSETSRSAPSSLADQGELSPLEDQLRDGKPDDMDEEEVQEVSRLLRWILEYDTSKRPSAEAILAHPWFN